MRLHFVVFGLAVILLLCASGCTSPAPVPPAATPAPVTTEVPATVTTMPVPYELTGSWVLTQMAIQKGTAILEPVGEITLTINNDRTLTGYGGCNNYNAVYTLTGNMTRSGDGMTVGPISSTKKNCATMSQQENTYYEVLGDTSAYVVQGGRLSLTGSSGNVLIYLRPSAVTTTAQVPHPA